LRDKIRLDFTTADQPDGVSSKVLWDNVRLEVFTAVTMKNGVFWNATPCDSCKNRRFGGTYASFIRVTRIGELGTTLTVTSNGRTLQRNHKYFFAACIDCHL
jgi:hypothetical protein